MIYETLQILKEQLGDYFLEIGLENKIELHNIALWEPGNSEADKINDRVILTLIRLEEETILKNTPHYKLSDNKTEYKNPPLHFNLYLLIAANFMNTDEPYADSLQYISAVIEFFQGKKVFTSANTVYNRDNIAYKPLDDFRFNLEIYSPTFDELNNIWGTLGGRQLPSVIYKVQLIQVERDINLAASGVITQIGGNLKNKN